MGGTNIGDNTRFGNDGFTDKTRIFERKQGMEMYGKMGGFGGAREDLEGEWFG